MVKVTIDRVRRTLTFRATGVLNVSDVKQALEEAKWAAVTFGGGEHIVVADLRGLAPMSPEVAAGFGEVIKFGREHGTAKCIHLSDSSIARLQAARLAREASTTDDITTNVVSVDEAEQLVEEMYKKLKK